MEKNLATRSLVYTLIVLGLGALGLWSVIYPAWGLTRFGGVVFLVAAMLFGAIGYLDGIFPKCVDERLRRLLEKK